MNRQEISEQVWSILLAMPTTAHVADDPHEGSTYRLSQSTLVDYYLCDGDGQYWILAVGRFPDE